MPENLNSNRISISSSGIQRAAGTRVTFTRETQQRITKITDRCFERRDDR
jgi:hypothetical protein